MKRAKIVITAGVVAAALLLSVGAKAMPISELQSGCGAGGGSWYSWTWFYEDDDGTLVGFSVSVCITPADGYDSIRAWFDEDQVESCYRAWNKGGSNCKTPWWDEEIRNKPAPSPTPTAPSDPRVGTTSGTYQEPTATGSPTTTGTTSGTYSR